VRGQADVDAFATKSAHEAAVMLWNYHDDDLPAGDAEVTVKIAGIPAGVRRVRLEHFRIDETHSNAYIRRGRRWASRRADAGAVREAEGGGTA